MSTRADTIFGASRTGGVSDAWLESIESMSQAEPSSIDEASVRSGPSHSRNTFRGGNSVVTGGQQSQASTSASNRPPASSVEFVTRQSPQTGGALTGNAFVNYTITGSLHPAARQHQQPALQPDYTRYTSLLKEYGENQGERPTYVEDAIGTTVNPLYSCEVRLRGITATGTARNKKLARGQASFNAWQQLGLRLT